ncbi:TAT-variant-translocated molybdopterin oxidoreductase [Archangium lansingense]|uniref:TAT-variant-translocated molybdopterin oxidoreductase n=1 Tax=Archangium lansingense TaxID=2995310 RepID=A0ABT4AIR8_9BACT|nr:TAT-variant-translocated molybdopterin oxidoreductase [Archangium lansinium]MCY1081584.1 TAT-variant-translocated molybdopterin oxidoreductase [Archangium lansinium]
MKPKLDGAPMKDTPTSFALPVVSDKAEAAHDHDHHHDVVGEALDHAAANAVTSEGAYGKTYWRSLEERLGQAEYLEETRPEFPTGADLPPTGVARREFMQLLGASMALAGATACSTRPVDERMVPYTRTPPEMVPGNPLHYASGMTFGGHTSGILVTAREGRPVKVEGNPQHPVNLGAAGVFEQAFLMSLYDPQRARVLRHRKDPRSLRTFGEEISTVIARAAQENGGARVRFLTEPNTSPVLGDLRERIQKRLPNAKFVGYTSVAQDAATEGARAVLGAPATPVYDFSKADVVLSLDADFLESRPANLAYARAFAKRRDPAEGNLNRLYVAEPRFTITGGMADHRLRAKSQEILAIAAAIASRVGGGAEGLGAAAAAKAQLNANHQKWVDAVAADLRAAAGRSAVVAGERQPAAVHALAAAINSALGNVPQTVRYVAATVTESTNDASLRSLVQELNNGAVDVLVITSWNPVYRAPVDLELQKALSPENANRSKLTVVYTSLFEDETSTYADWFIPAAHELESWSDGRSMDGTVSVVQPLIQPLYNGVPASELLALFLGEPYRSSYQILRDFWRGRSAALADFETAWETWVSVGIVPDTASAAITSTPNLDAARALVDAYTPPASGGLEVNFVTDYKVFDGQFANMSWLQELPDPISKITWDNAAYVSPATAESLKLQPGDMATLTYRKASLKVPVWITPGIADGVVVLPLGYGRTGLFETVAKEVGFNANLVRNSDAPWFDGGASLEKDARATHKFSLTQSHWRTEGRPIALDMPVEQFRKELEQEKHHASPLMFRVRGDVEKPNLLPDFEYKDYKWAMAIDLARCTGCAACVVACQAENNIPVVGKEQVSRSREMQWLRIDRYFSGQELHDPEMVMQPVACVHCEKAPCEYVCPVNATVHSDEGLNDMVYNRCVGTRYCSNNCPYKVRRFNYLHYTADKTPTQKMMMNPDVTVRNRGVMEKCTYCVQRIERVRIKARVEKRPIFEKELQTACQQTCPTEAIVFGTLSDPNAQVTKHHHDERAYKLLNELGTKPRTAHLIRLRNPNPALASAKPAGESHEGGH